MNGAARTRRKHGSAVKPGQTCLRKARHAQIWARCGGGVATAPVSEQGVQLARAFGDAAQNQDCHYSNRRPVSGRLAADVPSVDAGRRGCSLGWLLLDMISVSHAWRHRRQWLML